MKFEAALLAVSNLALSRQFYEEVLQQKVVVDLGANLTFSGGFALQQDYSGLLGVDGLKFGHANDHELYFEEEELDAFIAGLEARGDIEFLHPVKEYPWGQRVIRFYDPDKHIIEVGEPMASVFNKFARQGMSPEQIAARTMSPLPLIKQFLR